MNAPLKEISVLHACQMMLEASPHEDCSNRLMNDLNIFLLIIAIMRFTNIKCSLFFYDNLLLTVCNTNLSHTGRVEGGFSSVKQEHEEVKWYSFL